MTKITIDRAVVEQALHVATGAGYPVALIAALKAALEPQKPTEYEVAPNGRRSAVLTAMMNARTQAEAALAEPQEPDLWGAGYEAGYAAGMAERPAQPVQEADYSVCPTCGGLASDPIVPEALRAALAQPVRPLRRGVGGVCTRSTCECERAGLGDQCIWLRPA